jgi:hypothetical protein
MVRADGFGISLLTEQRLKIESSRSTGYVWRIPAALRVPLGLALNPDTRKLAPGEKANHYFLCPESDMTLEEYTELLSEFSLKLERIRKL